MCDLNSEPNQHPASAQAIYRNRNKKNGRLKKKRNMVSRNHPPATRGKVHLKPFFAPNTAAVIKEISGFTFNRLMIIIAEAVSSFCAKEATTGSKKNATMIIILYGNSFFAVFARESIFLSESKLTASYCFFYNIYYCRLKSNRRQDVFSNL